MPVNQGCSCDGRWGKIIPLSLRAFAAWPGHLRCTCDDLGGISLVKFFNAAEQDDSFGHVIVLFLVVSAISRFLRLHGTTYGRMDGKYSHDRHLPTSMLMASLVMSPNYLADPCRGTGSAEMVFLHLIGRDRSARRGLLSTTIPGHDLIVHRYPRQLLLQCPMMFTNPNEFSLLREYWEVICPRRGHLPAAAAMVIPLRSPGCQCS